jgi:hypothetical protein
MPRAVRLGVWAFALALAGAQAFAHRHAINPDGVSYLDLARAFLTGDLDTAINPYWGPVYPALIALGLRLARPGMDSVFAVAHAVNVGIFAGAMLAFDFFLRELTRLWNGPPSGAPPALSGAGLEAFGYALFLYAALWLIGLELVTPDLCVAMAVFAASGLVVRMCRRGPDWTTAVLLGIALGVGYLTKSVMFVLSLVLIVSLPLTLPAGARALRHVLGTAGVFLALATLLIVPISRDAGQLTFGTSGRLSYAFMVNHVPYANWQGDSADAHGDSALGHSRLLHPPRRVSSSPELYEYTANLKGTYPAWFDPTYWIAGLRTDFSLRNQAARLLLSLQFYVRLFMGTAGVATFLVVLIWLCTDASVIARELRRCLPLAVLGLAGLVIYAPVFLANRYIGSFATLLWLLPVAASRRLEAAATNLWLSRAVMVCAAILVTPIVVQTAIAAWGSRHERDPYPKVAAQLRALGVEPGDRVVNIGQDPADELGSALQGYWAYLAGVQIVAEMPKGRNFLCADDEAAAGIYRQLARLGARAAVTRAVPNRWCPSAWHQVEGTRYSVRLLEGDSRR